jgi:beta-lactam-binding protein with PASTA domain
LTIPQASSLVKGDGLTLQITGHANSSSVAANEILSQSPAAGTSIVNGGTLAVVISSGTNVVTLPTNLLGASCAVDTAALAKIGVVATCPSGDVIHVTSVAASMVAQVRYGSTINPLAVPAGASVTLYVSAAAPVTTTTTATGPRPVPNLVGDDQAQVQAALHAAGLYFSTRGPGHGTPAWKHVVSTVPRAGTTVPWHSTVILNVTEG